MQSSCCDLLSAFLRCHSRCYKPFWATDWRLTWQQRYHQKAELYSLCPGVQTMGKDRSYCMRSSSWSTTNIQLRWRHSIQRLREVWWSKEVKRTSNLGTAVLMVSHENLDLRICDILATTHKIPLMRHDFVLTSAYWQINFWGHHEAPVDLNFW